MTQELDDLEGTIAIVGMAGRFPGARGVAELWRNLRAGVESVRALSREEMAALGAGRAADDPAWVPAVAMPDGIDEFDAPFFGISHREAEILDPQHRLFLEACWTALEDAGYDPESPAAVTAVFGGATTSTYLLFNLARNAQVAATVDPLQLIVGNAVDSLTTRVSYKLNLKGASQSVQCACSTSLVAVHLACQALLNQECDVALAGGVSINVGQRAGYRFQEDSILAPDGHCRAFDAAARGTVFGGGAGVVVLKRLEDAVRDGDTVRAVIRGSAVNNDGGMKVGYTAPSVEGQAGGDRRGPLGGRDRCRDHRLHRGARHRHRPRRSDRDPGARQGVPRPHREAGLRRPRHGQGQHRPSRHRRRRRRADQDRARAAARRDPAQPPLRAAEPAHRLRRQPGLRQPRAGGVEARWRAPPGRRQLVRLRRHQRPRHPGGGAGIAGIAGAPGRRRAVAPAGRLRQDPGRRWPRPSATWRSTSAPIRRPTSATPPSP